MKLLDLINPYPIHERQSQAPWDSEKVAEIMRRNPRTIEQPYELARLMAQEHDNNALPNALHASLGTNLAYKAAKKATPYLKDSPAISRYRKMYGKHDTAAVISEIISADISLPPGQVLFHGGPWPENGRVPSVGANYVAQQPLTGDNRSKTLL